MRIWFLYKCFCHLRFLFFFVFLNCLLDAFLVRHYFSDICLSSVFRIESRGQNAMHASLVPSYLRHLYSFLFKLAPFLQQDFLLSLMLFNFFLEHLSDGLVSRWVKVVRQSDFFVFCQVWIMVDWWVEIKENWEVNRLIWIQKLILEAEALNFVKVQGAFLGEYLVNGDASDRLIRAIVHFIEG